MIPRRSSEGKRRFISLVGSPCDNQNESRGSSGTINRDRYNSVDGQLRLNVFNRISVS